MGLIAGITATRVFNSHILATDEFTIRLADGGVGGMELAEFELSDRAFIGLGTRSLIDETD